MSWGSRDGAVVRALTSHQCGPGSVRGLGVMWVEFVVGSLPCSERFFSGYSSFLLSSKTNISKFQFNLDTVENHLMDVPLLITINVCSQQASCLIQDSTLFSQPCSSKNKWRWKKCRKTWISNGGSLQSAWRLARRKRRN